MGVIVCGCFSALPDTRQDLPDEETKKQQGSTLWGKGSGKQRSNFEWYWSVGRVVLMGCAGFYALKL